MARYFGVTKIMDENQENERCTFIDRRRLMIRRMAAKIPDNAGNNMDEDCISPSSASTVSTFILAEPKGNSTSKINPF